MTTKKQITARKLANLGRAVRDQRLTDLDVRLLLLMADTASGETGIFKRPQTELAEQLGKTTRSVRYCLDRLVKFKYLEPVGQKPGKYISGYNVLGTKSGNYVPHSDAAASGNQKAEIPFPKAEIPFPKQENSFPHTSPSFPIHFPSDPTPTDDRGPRQRADALGPPPDTGKGLANGSGAAAVELEPLTPPTPLASLEADVRRLMGSKSTWLWGCRFEDLADGVLTILAPTPSMRDGIVKHIQTEIMEATGATEIRFKIGISQEPMMRRMP